MVTLYLTQHSPPALAMLPPMLPISTDDGSGGYHSPCSATACFTSALNSPGWHTAVRVTGSTVMSRIFSVDNTMGLVSQSPRSGRYDLGPSMRRLGAEALRRMDEVGLASEYLADLRDRTKHAVALLAWGENSPVGLQWEDGARTRFRSLCQLGQRLRCCPRRPGGCFSLICQMR